MCKYNPSARNKIFIYVFGVYISLPQPGTRVGVLMVKRGLKGVLWRLGTLFEAPLRRSGAS